MGYIGNRDAVPILLDGLGALEYRGYDSAGIYTPLTKTIKSAGKVSALRKLAEIYGGKAPTSGIAHTRWATHGEPNTTNAHPHYSSDRVFVVHNGIIENYMDLKNDLVKEGYEFVSETDTEITAHLIDSELGRVKGDQHKAFHNALAKLKGAYGLAVMFGDNDEEVFVARMGSPLVLGIGEGEYFIASDAAPIIRHTREMVYLEDGDTATVTSTGHRIMHHGKMLERQQHHVEEDVEEARKEGFDHFMLKEIMEAPEVVRSSIRGRIILEEGNVKLGGIEGVAQQLADMDRLVIVGCGTAYLAGVIGEYIIEELAGIPVEVEVGSEYRYRNPILDKKTAVLAISQSGETADTLEALREAKRRGALTLGIVNVVGSTIARETDAGVYNHIGPEVAVASTKAYLSASIILVLLGIFLGRQRSLSQERATKILKEITEMPEVIEKYIRSEKNTEHIKTIAEKYSTNPLMHSMLYLGRRFNNPIAFEGALKLKEVSYLHAEGYGSGEMKHGPLAMIDENFPTMVLATKDSLYEKTISNIQEIKARKGPVIAVANEGDIHMAALANDLLYVPTMRSEMLQAIINTIPLQLFAYFFATSRGLNVDQPRNLAKSVTVE